MTQYTRRAIIALVQLGATPEYAVEHVKTISRQRQYQIIWQSEGRCSQCGKPREEGYACYCKPCRLKQNNRKNSKYRKARKQ